MKFIKCRYDDAVNIDYIVYAKELRDGDVEFKDLYGTTHRYNGTLEEFIEEIRRISEDG